MANPSHPHRSRSRGTRFRTERMRPDPHHTLPDASATLLGAEGSTVNFFLTPTLQPWGSTVTNNLIQQVAAAQAALQTTLQQLSDPTASLELHNLQELAAGRATAALLQAVAAANDAWLARYARILGDPAPLPGPSSAQPESATVAALAAQITQLQARVMELETHLMELEDHLEEPGLAQLYVEAKAEGGTPIPLEQMLAEAGYHG